MVLLVLLGCRPGGGWGWDQWLRGALVASPIPRSTPSIFNHYKYKSHQITSAADSNPTNLQSLTHNLRTQQFLTHNVRTQQFLTHNLRTHSS